MSKYTIKKATRIKEGTSYEDIESGDAFEYVFLVKDEYGEIIMQTTNIDYVLPYMDKEDRVYLRRK